MDRNLGTELIGLLLAESDLRGFIGEPAVEKVSRRLAIPASRVYAVAGQLPYLTFVRARKPVLQVCCGPACALAGSPVLYEAARGADPGSSVDRFIGSPHWHVPIMAELRGAGERRAVSRAKPGDVAALQAFTAGEKTSLKALDTGVKTRSSAVAAGGERFATCVPAGKAKEPSRETAPASLVKAIKSSKLLNTVSGRELSGELMELADARKGGLVVCDIGGREPENSPGPVITAMNPRAVIDGLLLAAGAAGVAEALLFVPHEDIELRVLLAGLVDGLGERELAGVTLKVLSVPNMIPCDREIGIASLYRGLTLSEAVCAAAESREKLWGAHVVVGEPEVYAKVAAIAAGGARAYKDAPGGGTAVLTVGGRVKKPVMVESPLGATLEDLIWGMAGGLPKGGELKAVHVGGAFGGPLRPSAMGQSVKSVLRKSGSPSGQVLAMDQSSCMVQWGEYFARLTGMLCCGACVPGRLAPSYLVRIIERIRDGYGEPSDLDEIVATITLMKETSLCPQAGRSINALGLALANFRGEFEEHVNEKRCAAHVCWP